MTLRSKTMLLDFSGECDGARIRLVADLPDAGGAEDGGTVVLERDTATVTQPGGEIRLAAREPLRWNGGPADVEFVLPESPESTVLAVRGLAVQVE
ncbi:MAG TPA: hypothetical protein VF821_22500 [Lentzea sp.]